MLFSERTEGGGEKGRPLLNLHLLEFKPVNLHFRLQHALPTLTLLTGPYVMISWPSLGSDNEEESYQMYVSSEQLKAFPRKLDSSYEFITVRAIVTTKYILKNISKLIIPLVVETCY